MKRSLPILMAAALALLLNGSPTHAESRCPACGRLHAMSPASPPATPAPVLRSRPQRPADPSWFQPELYPKYYGGFHYRVLQNYGYPAGDIGVRGTAW